MHIAFELPSHVEIQELFLSMYADIDTPAATGLADDAASTANEKEAPADGKGGTDIDVMSYNVSDGLKELAGRLARGLPEGKLSLASIQGYLLGWKRDPRKACEGVEEWGKEAARKIEAESGAE